MERVPPEREVRVLALSPPSRGAEARWERFEAEFGLTEKKPTLLKGSLYQVDRALFTVKDFFENTLNFDYALRDIGCATPSKASSHRNRTNPFLDALENAHLKSDIKLSSLTGHGFVGVKLVLPVGN